MRLPRPIALRGLSRRLVGAAAAVVVVCATVVASAGGASASTGISGGGSSFAAPEVQQWAADVAHPPASLTVNYANNSSGAGRDDYAQGYYQYGATDIVYYANDGTFQNQAQSQHPFNYVTVSAGGLAFMYNIVIGGQRWTGLQLTQQEACQIFTGQLTNWSQLASTPGDAILASVNQPITTVLRSDAAGESYVLSQYCIAVDPTDWSTFVSFVGSNNNLETGSGWSGDADMSAGKPVEYWPSKLEDNGTNNNITASGAPAEVNAITDTNNGGYSIGYVAAVYALTAGYPMASVQNAGGAFVQPNATSVQTALSYATANPTGTFDLSFTGSNPAAYFPSTYSYILAPTTTNSPASGAADAVLAQFLCFAVGQGQSSAAKLLYAPLSAQVTALSVSAIQGIPGAPAASSCGTGGPAPVIATTSPAPSGTTPTAGSTATAAPAGSASKTATTAAPGSATSKSTGSAGSTSATTAVGSTSATTVAGSTATTIASSASSPSGVALGATGAASSSSPTSVELASSSGSSGTTNSEAYWWLALGALVCALGVLGVGAAKATQR
jgi:ABC-type phosphate transport system substrate-binding protein